MVAHPQVMDLLRRMGEKYGAERCLTIMKTLGNRSNNFSFFLVKPLTSQHQGWGVRQRTNIWDICHGNWPISKSCLFHSSSMLLANHIQMSQGSWDHTEQCLGSEVFSLVCSYCTPSAVDPCCTFPIGLPPWAHPFKGRKSSRQQGPGEVSGEVHLWQLHPAETSLVSTSCSVQYQKSHKRSGKCSQIMWKWGI